MKKINLKGISEILSEKEMKNVMGGSGCGSSQSSCSGVCSSVNMGWAIVTLSCKWTNDLSESGTYSCICA